METMVGKKRQVCLDAASNNKITNIGVFVRDLIAKVNDLAGFRDAV